MVPAAAVQAVGEQDDSNETNPGIAPISRISRIDVESDDKFQTIYPVMIGVAYRVVSIQCIFCMILLNTY